jgi:glucose 1-dehydrogenase
VLLRVEEVGVCGTDRELARFQLGHPPEGDENLVIGHEAVGQVVKTASGGTSVREGDWVVPMVRRPCKPPCTSCVAGRRDLCVSGRFTERGIFGAHGYFAEFAVDDAADLVVIPPDCRSISVLIEPLSVVEKAIDTAIRLHIGAPRTALVVGAGTIGLLAAAVLKLRGYEATLLSREAKASARARLIDALNIAYTELTRDKFDVVIEAAGSNAAAALAVRSLRPLGVMVVLGAKSAELPLIDMIVNNQVIAGSVNASPEAFARAVEDLPKLPRQALSAMIRREPFSAWRSTLWTAGGEEPKSVHVIAR